MMKSTWQTLLATAGAGAALSLAAPHARGEEIEGLVRVVGASLTTEVLLTSPEQVTGPSVCFDDVGKKVARFASMTVKVTGESWKYRKNGEKRCFIANAFAITKAPSGRPPVIGTLLQKDGVFVVKADDGQEHKLADIPAGMKKLEGQKVILDAKPMEAPTGKGATFKVVTYGLYPQ